MPSTGLEPHHLGHVIVSEDRRARGDKSRHSTLISEPTRILCLNAIDLCRPRVSTEVKSSKVRFCQLRSFAQSAARGRGPESSEKVDPDHAT